MTKSCTYQAARWLFICLLLLCFSASVAVAQSANNLGYRSGIPMNCNTSSTALQVTGGYIVCGTVAGTGGSGSGSGSVTSVAVSGGTTGLTTTGGPVTTSGTITLNGTLAVANGGTGATTSTGTGSVVLSNSPSLTGTPVAVTTLINVNNEQIATTGFVHTLLGSPGPFGNNTPGNVFAVNLSAIGTSTLAGATGGATASAGNIGENISSDIASGSAVDATTGTAFNITSVSLTAGDWICGGGAYSNPAGTTTTTGIKAWLNTNSATFPSTTLEAHGATMLMGVSAAAGIALGVQVGDVPFNVTTTTTVYLSANVTFAVSTLGGYGLLSCNRTQ